MSDMDAQNWTPEERAALEALPRERPPSALLEERIVRDLRREGLLRPPTPKRLSPLRWWAGAAAAGVALFLAGFGVGQSRGSDRAFELVEAVREADAGQRAALVQRTGSMWVTALAGLAEGAGDEEAQDEAGREVALAALRGAVAELARLHPDDGRVARIRDILEERPAQARYGAARQTIWF